MSGPAPSNERRASTSNLSGRAPSIFYTKMVDDEVRKRGSSRCVSSQPAAEQLLITHSPKSPPALSPYPRWHSLRTPLCIAIAATPSVTPPHAVRVRATATHATAHHASQMPLPYHMATCIAIAIAPALRQVRHYLLFSRCTPMLVATCYFPAVFPTCIATAVCHGHPYLPLMRADI